MPYECREYYDSARDTGYTYEYRKFRNRQLYRTVRATFGNVIL
jgi:hypothetical protein